MNQNITTKEENVKQYYGITALYEYQLDAQLKPEHCSNDNDGRITYTEITTAYFEHERGKDVHNEWLENLYYGIDYDGVMYDSLFEKADMSCEGYDDIAFYDENGDEIELDKDGVPVMDKVVA